MVRLHTHHRCVLSRARKHAAAPAAATSTLLTPCILHTHAHRLHQPALSNRVQQCVQLQFHRSWQQLHRKLCVRLCAGKQRADGDMRRHRHMEPCYKRNMCGRRCGWQGTPTQHTVQKHSKQATDAPDSCLSR